MPDSLVPDKLKPSIRGASYWLSRYTWGMMALWTVIVVVLLLFNILNTRKEFSDLAHLEAIVSFNKDTVYRRWITIHGGVYVPISENTPPNPYLNVPERDISTPSGTKLTLINPAYMTRQVHELGKQQYGLQGHITSLKPLNPVNAPDSWETVALKDFEHGKDEVICIETIENQPYLRMIRPFITEKGCLKCHGHQGYKVGDIRGGISIAVPMEPYLASAQRRSIKLTQGIGFLWLIGIGVLWGGMGYILKRIKEKEAAEQERDKYINELQQALSKVKKLSGLLPICMHCKSIRNDDGYWKKIEEYVQEYSEAQFSHSICRDCAKKHYPDYDIYAD